MVKTFILISAAAARKMATIKITPSQYGYYWLSQRAIPYYYRITVGTAGLYNYWNFYKSSHGNAVFNLSYHADLYNHAKAAVQPLLYDIEHYNFFRIEGHIGEQYTTVIKNILNQRLDYNMPFDVVAISADMLRSNAKLPVCNMQDLETDYKLILSEFACKVHTPFCFLTKLPYPPSSERFVAGLKEDMNIDSFSQYRRMAMTHFNSTMGTSGAYVKSSAYKVGDFMRQYCMPQDDNTIGSYYLQSLDSLNRMYYSQMSDLKQSSEQTALSLLYNYIFGFIDAVEQLMYLLMTSAVSNIDMAMLERRYEAYTKSAGELTMILAEMIAAKQLKLSALFRELEFDILIDEFFVLSTVCIDERLQTLVDEYRRRLELFQAQNTFLNYYRKHPGLEHKAGVPKGGTFVLVYYTEERETTGTFSNVTEIAGIMKEQASTAAKEKIVYKNMSNADEKMIREFVRNCDSATPGDKNRIIGIFEPPPSTQRFRFKEGEVIADFYVPYMCCSDCPPVAYILEEKLPRPPKETPTIKMATNFCDTDAADKIGVAPAGGELTDENGNRVKGVDDTGTSGNEFTFDPRAAGAGIYNLVYTVDKVASDPVTVTVHATPQSSSFKFTYEMVDQGAFSVTFTPDSPGTGFAYEWTFGDGFTPASSTEESPKVQANVSNSGAQVPSSASLQISNGKCSCPAHSVDLIITGNGVFDTSIFAQELGNLKDVVLKDKTAVKPKEPAEPVAKAEEAIPKETSAPQVPAAPAPAEGNSATDEKKDTTKQ